MDHEHWQLDGNAPELFQKYLVPTITAKWAEDIVDRARPQAGEEILDIACGTGVVAAWQVGGFPRGTSRPRPE